MDYGKVFLEFCRRSTEWKACLAWVAEQPLTSRNKIQRVLSVGAGDGSFDREWLVHLPEMQHYVALEPYASHFDELKQRFAEDARAEIIQSGFEGFESGSSFDLIVFAHSLYYMKDREKQLQRARAMLKPGGQCWVFHQTERGIHEIQQRFGDAKTQQYSLTAENIAQALTGLGVSYVSTELPATIDVRNAPKDLVDFFLERDTTPDEYARVGQFLREHGPYLDHPVCALTFKANENMSSLAS